MENRTMENPIEEPSPDLDKANITFDDIAPFLQRIKHSSLLVTEQIGESFSGTPIYSVTLGQGPVHLLFWSQMHGNEPTATAAIMDFFEYVHQPEQQSWLTSWQNILTVKFIPMLNPDGAALNQRENAQGIDINRDAIALQSPEGQLLMKEARAFKPVFGFNLHDQSRHYAVGDSGKPATISVLAPAFNPAREINQTRGNAMRLIGQLIPLIETAIPGQLARYDDTYSSRSFGDTFSAMGISTILIESGGQYADPNRQTARKINLQLYLAAINNIRAQDYLNASLEHYHSLKFNREDGIQDIIVRNVTVQGSKDYKIDIAITSGATETDHGVISMVGDLSPYGAYQEFNAQGWHFVRGKPYQLDEDSVLTLNDQTYAKLLSQGFTHFTGASKGIHIATSLPVMVNQNVTDNPRPVPGQIACFLLIRSENCKKAMINGKLLDLSNGTAD